MVFKVGVKRGGARDGWACMEKGRKIHLMVQGCPSPHLTDIPCIPCGPPHMTPSETHGLAGAWGSEGSKGKTRL